MQYNMLIINLTILTICVIGLMFNSLKKDILECEIKIGRVFNKITTPNCRKHCCIQKKGVKSE